MKKTTIVLFLLLGIVFYMTFFASDWVIGGPPSKALAQQRSDKFDQQCTGRETVGRCADKKIFVPTAKKQNVYNHKQQTSVSQFAGK